MKIIKLTTTTTMYPTLDVLKSIISILLLMFHHVSGDIYIVNADNTSVEALIDYKITYTPDLSDEGIFGSLTQAIPSDACRPIQSPPNDPTVMNWFVLAYRSTSFHARCSNRDKIKNAAQAGYKVIILYSPVDMYHPSVAYSPFEHSNVTIPAVLVAHEDGKLLRDRYLYLSGYSLHITPDSPPNFSYYLIPFAIVIGAGILIIISYLIFQLMMCIMERRRAQRHRLSKKYLKKLTLQKFEKGIFYETCAICLDDYIEGEKIRILPCNHAYHQKCIDPWLTKNRRVCPVCKAKVTLPGMEEYTDSDSDNDRGRLTSSEPPSNETSRLLSTSARTNRNNRNARNLRSFSVLIDATRNDSTLSTLDPPATIIRGSQLRSSNQSSSNNRYQLLDDSLIQPGPSTSAPIISELSSARDHLNRRIKRKKRRSSTRPNVQVVVADVQPLIAPAQLSINCDSESERPITPVNDSTNRQPLFPTNSSSSSSNNAPQPPSSSSSSRRSNYISADQIV